MSRTDNDLCGFCINFVLLNRRVDIIPFGKLETFLFKKI